MWLPSPSYTPAVDAVEEITVTGAVQSATADTVSPSLSFTNVTPIVGAQSTLNFGYVLAELALVQDRSIDPGRVFDLTLPMIESPEGYRAMDERRAIKVLLEP